MPPVAATMPRRNFSVTLMTSGGVGREEDEEGGEGESHGLNGDAGVAEVQHGGKGAEEESLQQGVDGRGDGRPFAFEAGDEGEDESAKDADNHLQRYGGRVVGCRELIPGEAGGDDGEQEQDSGFVDGATEGHGSGSGGSAVLGAGNAAAIRAVGAASEGIAAEGGIGSLEQGHEVSPYSRAGLRLGRHKKARRTCTAILVHARLGRILRACKGARSANGGRLRSEKSIGRLAREV